mmetsp:Transcript_13232/g.20653  ORF Transcript_13232/g.20653 Transcript_13232/m.20653 type:complete len:103 (-) Transcript_13232:206-514(-)
MPTDDDLKQGRLVVVREDIEKEEGVIDSDEDSKTIEESSKEKTGTITGTKQNTSVVGSLKGISPSASKEDTVEKLKEPELKKGPTTSDAIHEDLGERMDKDY